jgi:hypothetical protein
MGTPVSHNPVAAVRGVSTTTVSHDGMAASPALVRLAGSFTSAIPVRPIRPSRKPHLARIGLQREEEYTSPRVRPTLDCLVTGNHPASTTSLVIGRVAGITGGVLVVAVIGLVLGLRREKSRDENA